jgi:hypothetical protein
MISDEGVISLCILYIIGVGICSYKLSTYKKTNCFGKKKETNIQNDEYTLV